MASNMVEQIREAESKGDEIVQDAKKKAEGILAQIKTVGKEKYDSIIEDGEKTREDLLKNARIEGEKKEAPIIQQSNEIVHKIQNMDEGKLQEVANSIVERVVSEYVNG
ncbi:hypothetical protein [Lagierella sp.]|uniref:hypothetical protein n=1 Tax=Lagierella sp. TaxID=2849657 RepID=UPI0026209A80|nr:hypothetical protein [Lagierella sp.]